MPAGTNVPSGVLVTPGGQQGIPGPNYLPTGAVIDFGGSSAPTGWLLCDGTSYPTAAYPALFAVLQYTFGGSGANFNVPDARSRSSIGAGQGTGLTSRTLGANGGEENHQLSVGELAIHNHGTNESPHTHQILSQGGASLTSGANNYNVVSGLQNSGGATTGITIQNTGSGTGHNTMMPFLVLNKIIKT